MIFITVIGRSFAMIGMKGYFRSFTDVIVIILQGLVHHRHHLQVIIFLCLLFSCNRGIFFILLPLPLRGACCIIIQPLWIGNTLLLAYYCLVVFERWRFFFFWKDWNYRRHSFGKLTWCFPLFFKSIVVCILRLIYLLFIFDLCIGI